MNVRFVLLLVCFILSCGRLSAGISLGALYFDDELSPVMRGTGCVFTLRDGRMILVETGIRDAGAADLKNALFLAEVGEYTFFCLKQRGPVASGVLSVDGKTYPLSFTLPGGWKTDPVLRKGISQITVNDCLDIGVTTPETAEILHRILRGENLTALKLLDNLVRRRGDSALFWYLRARIYHASKLYPKARLFLDRAARLSRSLQWRLLDARIDMDTKDMTSAAKKLQSLLTDRPEASQALRYAAVFNYRCGRQEDRLNTLLRARSLNPAFNKFIVSHIDTLDKLGRNEDAYRVVKEKELYNPEPLVNQDAQIAEIRRRLNPALADAIDKKASAKTSPVKTVKTTAPELAPEPVGKTAQTKPDTVSATTIDEQKPMPATAKPDFSFKRETEAFRKLPPLPPRAEGQKITLGNAIEIDDFLNTATYKSVVSNVCESFRELTGPMTPEAEAAFNKKWNAIRDYPTPEIIAYLQNISPPLNDLNMLKALILREIESCDALLADANYARDFGNHTAVHDIMREFGEHTALLGAYKKAMREAAKKIEALGEPPDPAEQKKEDAKSYRVARKTVQDLLISSAKDLSIEGEYTPCEVVFVRQDADGEILYTLSPHAPAQTHGHALQFAPDAGRHDGGQCFGKNRREKDRICQADA